VKAGTAIVLVGGAALLVGGAAYLLTRPPATAPKKPPTPASWAGALGTFIATVGGRLVANMGQSGGGKSSTVGAVIPGSVQNGVGVTGTGNLVDVDEDVLVDSLDHA